MTQWVYVEITDCPAGIKACHQVLIQPSRNEQLFVGFHTSRAGLKELADAIISYELALQEKEHQETKP